MVDEATRVTWPRKTEHCSTQPDATDLELLAWLTELRFALATQIHRRFGAGKSYSTTQRRLKRLSQAGWVLRFQFFRETGASSALTYLVTKDGIATVKDARRSARPIPRSAARVVTPEHRGSRHARSAARPAHQRLGAGARGPRGCGGQPRPRAPELLRSSSLPHARGPATRHRARRASAARRANAAGLPADRPGRRRATVEQFAAIEPNATVELRVRDSSRIDVFDLFVELDRTFRPTKNIDKFERYDHMISGWCNLKHRYAKALRLASPGRVRVPRPGERQGGLPRGGPRGDRGSCLRWRVRERVDYPGRERMFFVAERDIHEGRLVGYALPAHPPQVRSAVADYQSARECHPRQRAVFSRSQR